MGPSYDSTPVQSKKSTIGDLPDILLVEILCRLPIKEFVFQCKCVSKHWLNLISDPYFIARFLHLQRFHKQTRIARTLIDRRGEEFPATTQSSSASNLLAALFKRLTSYHGLEENPCVATSNDLVLCCRTPLDQYQRDFYICNPCTRQWIALPPTTRCCMFAPVGFISDRYYEDEDSIHSTSSSVKLKKDYRCKVVRILPHDSATISLRTDEFFSKYIVEVFSFETGEWRESVVSSRRSIKFGKSTGVAHNGMLYWTYMAYDEKPQRGLIALDPFVIGNDSSAMSNGGENVDDDPYQLRLVDAVRFQLLGKIVMNMCVRQRRLQILTYCIWNADFSVWELTDDLGSAQEFYLKRVSTSPQPPEVSPHNVVHLTLDPNDMDILYVKMRTAYHLRRNDNTSGEYQYFKHDMSRRKCTRIATAKYFEDICLYPLALSRWPTPLLDYE